MKWFLIGVLFLFFPLVWAVNSCGDTNNVCTFDSNISVDQNWVDGNTYVILADVNVTGAGTDLNIAPGTVVKYGVGRSLIARDGGRVLANGTVDKNIIFTSCRDQNSYVGSTNANTATISGCSGGPAPSEYNTAIYVLGNAGMTKADSFSYLKIFDAKYGIRLDQNIGSIHDSNFSFFKSLGLAYSGVFLGIETDVNIYGNAFSWFQTDAKGIYVTLDKTFAGAIYQNSFSNFQSAHAIYLEQSSTGPIYSNRFDSFSNTTGTTATGIYLGLETTGNIYQNIFSNFNGATGISKWLGAVNATIYNNLFYNFTASGVGIQSNWQDFGGNILNNTFSNLQTSTAFVAYDPSTTRIQRNLFSNVSTAISGTITGAISNNAYYSVGTIGKPGPNDQNSATGFTTTPFIADNTDRNFLLNTTSTGGAMLVDAGGVDSNGVDINNFFNLKTTQLNNKLDTGTIDIGYHFDQNGPYVQVLSPNDFNTLTGVQTIDFNVESAYDSVSVITAALAYSLIGSGNGTAIVSQLLSSYSCSQGPVFRCSYSWNTTTVLDGNYFIRLAGTDTNDTAIDFSDANFVVSNDSTAPVTSADYNNAWQNVDANVVLTCVDASGCSLTQFRLDSDSSDVVSMGSWQTFDQNILITSDGNWGIDFNSTDTVGNRETTNRVYVLIDKSLPTLSLTVTSVKTVGLSATLSFSGSSESGIKKYWISSDGGTTYSDNGTTETYSFSVSSAVSLPHTRRVYIKAMNNADINTAAQSVDVLFEPAGGGSTSVSCGNNICEVDENASVCPLDCPNVCGDRACTHTENNFSCPFDCAIGCGNGICDARESKQTCPTDCDPTGGGIIDVNINRPDGSENPITVPLIPQNKACESDSDCGVSTSCSISRCIRNQCYGGQLPEGEPCDIGSVCKQGVCSKISRQLEPVSESDPILWVSISVIVLALGAIGYEYFKK